ncbi:hypothetical protein [Streptomyces sp. NPDC021562]|uniref:hypothetical protein n=1 Tax=Streptomyces sp. NPDC021562 TaxID=3155121 RepID=UPI00104B734F
MGDRVVARPPSWRAGALYLVGAGPLGTPAFPPNGSRLAADDMTGRVTLWDSDLRHRVAAVRRAAHYPREAIYTLAFGFDRSTLYAGSAHVPRQRYDLDSAHALARVCARTGGSGLSPAQ